LSPACIRSGPIPIYIFDVPLSTLHKRVAALTERTDLIGMDGPYVAQGQRLKFPVLKRMNGAVIVRVQSGTRSVVNLLYIGFAHKAPGITITNF
jgi:hypothetical protein